MIQALHIMDRNTPAISFDASVESAVDFFRTHSGGFALVRAASDRIQGVLTEAGLVRISLKHQSDPLKNHLVLFREVFEPVQLCLETEEFPEIVKKILSAVGQRVFVINPAGSVTGYITARMVLPYLASSRSSEEGRGEVQAGATGGQHKFPTESIKKDLFFFESFFTKSPFMMHSVNREGIIQMANEMIHLVLGYTYGDLIGKTIHDLYPPSSHKQAEMGIKTIFSEGFHKVVRSEMVAKDGHRVAVELVSRALTDQHSNPIGTMTISRPMDMQFLVELMPELL